MHRVLLVLLALTARAQAPSRDCSNELAGKWNRFATDANAYVSGLNQGVVSSRLRARLNGEWRAVTQCECW